MTYNPWPLGKLTPEQRRTEPEQIRELGYEWTDAREIVTMFEQEVAGFFGAPYAVAVDCCSNAIFLSLMYDKHTGYVKDGAKVYIPRHTYVSVPMQIVHAGLVPMYMDFPWKGYYPLYDTHVIDAAVIWQHNAYVLGSMMCLSFQIKKAIPIGKGGMILTDSKDAYDWLKLASYDGRDLNTPYDDPRHVKMVGWHMYMTPEDAARGLLLMHDVGDKGAYMGSDNYPDVGQMMKHII